MGPVSNRQPVPAPALIAEATKRAGLIWIKAGTGRPYPAWHVWHPAGPDGAAYVLTGPGEQPLPGLAGARRATVLVRSKDTGGLVVTWTAEVSQVVPESPEWDAVAGQLLAGRLNPGGTSPAGHWAATGTVFRLRPVDAGQPPADAAP